VIVEGLNTINLRFRTWFRDAHVQPRLMTARFAGEARNQASFDAFVRRRF
jgi:hypothetical protein